LEGKLREMAVSEKNEFIVHHKTNGWVDVEYLERSVEQLIACRRVLKHTYIHAFYLPDGPEKNLFEYLQQDLETNTELLSGVLENKSCNREDVLNISKLAKTRLHHLLKGVENGFMLESIK
jgi:hypothetical protein